MKSVIFAIAAIASLASAQLDINAAGHGSLAANVDHVLDGTVNGAVNGDLNGNLNGGLNGAVNGAVNGDVNGAVNGLNGAVKGDLGLKLGLNLNLPAGLTLPDGIWPTSTPGEGCTDVYHPAHIGIDIDSCDDDSSEGWHWVHPGQNYPNQCPYTWTSTVVSSLPTTVVISCPTDVPNCPGQTSYTTDVTCAPTTTICPVSAPWVSTPTPVWQQTPASYQTAAYQTPSRVGGYQWTTPASTPYGSPYETPIYHAGAASTGVQGFSLLAAAAVVAVALL